MATAIKMVHPDTGIIKTAYYGFSWTSFFFGPLPILFRGETIKFLLVFVVCCITGGLYGIYWWFACNKWHTYALLERGYVFQDSDELIAEAKRKLKIADNMNIVSGFSPEV